MKPQLTQGWALFIGIIGVLMVTDGWELYNKGIFQGISGEARIRDRKSNFVRVHKMPGG